MDVKKYSLCIELNIDGEVLEQELATLSLEAIEKYTSYCKCFSTPNRIISSNDIITVLRKTHKKIADFLDKYKTSNQPLFIKYDGKRTDIPVLYNEDIDVLLATEEELNGLLIKFNEPSISSYEDKIRIGKEIKERNGNKNIFDLNANSKRINENDNFKIETEKDRRLKKLNADLDFINENFGTVLSQIDDNVSPLVSLDESKKNKLKNEKTEFSYVVTGMRHEEDANKDNKYTINDELENYKRLRNQEKDPKEKNRLSMIVDTTEKVIEYRQILKVKNNSEQEVKELQLILAKYEARLDDLLNGNVHYGDGGLEIDDPNYGGK